MDREEIKSDLEPESSDQEKSALGTFPITKEL
jgi:hypothetical protein